MNHRLHITSALVACLVFACQGKAEETKTEKTENTAEAAQHQESPKLEAETGAVSKGDAAAPPAAFTEEGVMGRGGKRKDSVFKSEEAKPRPASPRESLSLGGAVAQDGAVGSAPYSLKGGPMHDLTAEPEARPAPGVPTNEKLTDYGINGWFDSTNDPLSTFAVDVDTGSYTMVRGMLNHSQRVPPAAVRVEEFVNYFSYDYPNPVQDMPFSVAFEAAPSPLEPKVHLVRIGIQGRQPAQQQRLAANLVFLVDVSGSMRGDDRIELAKGALRVLVDRLDARDSVALVTYAGRTEVVLQATPGSQKEAILEALDGLTTGGGTSMGTGMELAYEQALSMASPEKINRVIVISDGDANIGKSNHTAIHAAVADYVKQGITLTTIGVGRGNYNDTMMEQLANKGNGNYFYLDDQKEAIKVFGEQLNGTLEVIAKDVKIQVEWNPEVVPRYRLIGYENRDIADEDFRNDAVDAGEIGAGHQVTAVYEVELAQQQGPLGTVRIRHKEPNGDTAVENSYALGVEAVQGSFKDASADFRFAASVAYFADRLRLGSQYDFETLAALAKSAADKRAERLELVKLIEKAGAMPQR